MKNYLITGASSYLASNLIPELLKQEGKFYLVTRDLKKLENFRNHKNVELLLLDGCFYENISTLNIDVVFHIAATYSTAQTTDEMVLNSNFDFPKMTIEAIKNREKKISFFHMDTPIARDTNLYSKTKGGLVSFLKNEFDFFNVYNFKIENFYGAGDSRFVNWLIDNMKERIESLDFTDGLQRRDFIYVTDVCDALLTVLNNSSKLVGFCEFDVGSGVNHSIRELVNLIKKVTDNSETICNWGAVPNRNNELMESTPDLSPLKKLGWLPKYSLEEGIKKSI